MQGAKADWPMLACEGLGKQFGTLAAVRDVTLALLLVFGVPAGVRAGTNVANGVGREIPRMYVIDVRTESEWNAGHIAGAILIPYDQISARFAEVTTNKSASIGLYCRSGRRSGIASKSLQALGYTNVENLGGLQEARKRLEPGSP